MSPVLFAICLNDLEAVPVQDSCTGVQLKPDEFYDSILSQYLCYCMVLLFWIKVDSCKYLDVNITKQTVDVNCGFWAVW